MKGPYPIVCRAHSGGRLLSEVYIKNGIQMGHVHLQTKDTQFFAVRKNYHVFHLINQTHSYHNSQPNRKQYLKNIAKQNLANYITTDSINVNDNFGWKFGETLYILPPLLDAFPSAKAVHLIRDGRDVMLSRIPARFNPKRFHESWNRLIVMGNKSIDSFKGEYLNAATIDKYRTELELLHWKNVVEFGKKLRVFENQYLEVSYEELCSNPDSALDKISEFLNVPFNHESREWARQNASTARIGKWQKEDPDLIQKIIEPHKDTLEEFGYI